MNDFDMTVKNIKRIFDHKDYMLISSQRVVTVIKKLLPSFKVRCELNDRNGRIGILITSINEDINHDKYSILLNNNKIIKLEDRYLYNVIFNNIKQEYSVLEHDEYYEKVESNYD